MILSILYTWILISSCSFMNSEKSLPGKILVSKTQENACFFYEDSDTAKWSFKEKNDEEAEYSVMAWWKTKDAFFGTEGIPGSIPMEYRCNIVMFDLSGKIIDRIYEAEKGELAWPRYSSWDDKYLIFTTERKLDPELYPLDGLAPMLSLVIMDLEQKKIIIKIDSIGRFPNFQIEESPWLHEGYQFVYSTDGATKLQLKGEEKLLNPVETAEGVYLFDIVTGKRKLLIPGASAAIASPTSNQIAYEKEHSIIVRDLNTNKEKTIYKYRRNEVITSKHWTPDGKSIYFSFISRSAISDMYNEIEEKLMEVSSGKELPFKSIGMADESYTWK